MRKLIITLIILGALVAGIAVYLIATTPKHAELLRFPLTSAQRKLLERVPADAEGFGLIPAAGLLQDKLASNAITAEPLLQWQDEHELPRPWMLGGADVVAWKRAKTTSYVVRLDPFRALVLRIWLTVASGANVRWEGSTLIINDPTPSARSNDLDVILRLASGLPAADAFIVQRSGARGAFPPIARPAVNSVRIAKNEIVIVSRAASDDLAPARTIHAQYPRGAMLSVTFAEPLHILGDLNRLLGARIDELVEPGGSIALYEVETGTLLPRPRGVIVVPATEQSRAAMANLMRVAEVVGETRDTGQQIQVAFDRTSLGLYSKDAFAPASWPATRWSMHIDPARLVPVLRRLADSAGLRFVTPRIHRGVRDLRKWIDAVERAESIEAASSVTAGVEELRVRVTSK
ncbi:MAG TPA: hypothetical protein VJZ00_17690 [Thermoanaerobaculia bacterium]|nr:hypothetical protein [Thermoanaerobaculia bacterium]